MCRISTPHDLTSCLKGSIGNPFDVTWCAGGSSSTSCTGATTCPQLDGMQVIISLGLASTSNQNVLIPENGCITASPNYWYGTGSPDCAVLRSDATFSTDLSSRLGRMSIKGTVYAPSAAMDIDDTDVYYPIGGRGIIVRHLRIRGYQAHSGYGTAAFSNEVDKNPVRSQRGLPRLPAGLGHVHRGQRHRPRRRHLRRRSNNLPTDPVLVRRQQLTRLVSGSFRGVSSSLERP